MEQTCKTTGILALLFVQLLAFGQSPYDSFDKKQSEKHTYRLPEMVFRAENEDTTDIFRYVELDIETLQLRCFSANDSLLAEIQLKQGDVKFISRDPKFEKYFGTSPYAYCGNNPVSRIDPTGMDWVETTDGTITWNKNVTSQDNTPEGGKYIGTRYMGLSIAQYNAIGNKNEKGIIIRADYNSEEKKDTEARWVQTVTTNVPLGGATSPYNDPQPPDDDKPFYWTDAELPKYKNKSGHDLLFYDRVTRASNGDKWEGELSLVVKGSEEYKSVITIKYGFEIQDGKAVPTQITVSTPSDFQNKTINDYNATIKK